MTMRRSASLIPNERTFRVKDRLRSALIKRLVTRRPYAVAQARPALPLKADMRELSRYVRFVPILL